MLGSHLLLALMASTATCYPTQEIVNNPASRAVDFRLPTSVKPLAYDIKLVPFIAENNFTFLGEVLIAVQALEGVTNITLHASRLDIDVASIVVTDVTFSETVEVTGVQVDEEAELYSIMLATPLRQNLQYTISIKRFSGVLADDMFGFYRSSYVENGVRRWLASTQFWSTSARRAFPCFDEPALKARVTLSISRTGSMRAVSNMPQDGPPVLDTEHTDELRYWDHFLESPPMSTYLIAFLVSDFVYLENAVASLRVFTQPQMLSQARYSLAVSPPLLDWLADFTGIPFHLPKMDEVAVPDFAFGAMENWGLVTYKERTILFQEGVSTSSNRHTTSTVIAHEFAHQWFGDLVTPVWWQYLWLNEGFATYFEYFCTAGVETTWRLEEQFVVLEVQSAMASDASQNSRAMSFNPVTPEQVGQIGSSIDYAKAGSVLRMLEHMVSPSIFRRGIRRYLLARSYDAATSDDLYNILNAQLHEDNSAADFDVKTVMDTWSNQMGYPVVMVTRDYAANTAQLTQERFLLSYDVTHPDTHDYKWHIPLTYTTQTARDFNSTSPRDWFSADDVIKVIGDMPGDTEWVLFNVKENGYYRVNYDASNWALLTSQLDGAHSEIHALSRAQLVDDSFNLARADALDYDTALSLARFLARDDDYVVWTAAFSAFGFIDLMLGGVQDYPVFQEYLLSLMSAVYSSVGLEEGEDDGHVLKLTRGVVARWACNMGDQACVTTATTLYSDWMATPNTNPITADLKSAVYCTALKQSDVTAWNFLYERYLASRVATEASLIITVLGCTDNAESLNTLMRLAITPGSSIRRHDSNAVFTSIFNNPGALDTALDFITENFQDVAAYYGSMGSVGNLLLNLARRSTRQEHADKMQVFLDASGGDLGEAAASVQGAISIIGDNIAWQSTYGQIILDWINNNQHRYN